MRNQLRWWWRFPRRSDFTSDRKTLNKIAAAERTVLKIRFSINNVADNVESECARSCVVHFYDSDNDNDRFRRTGMRGGREERTVRINAGATTGDAQRGFMDAHRRRARKKRTPSPSEIFARATDDYF